MTAEFTMGRSLLAAAFVVLLAAGHPAAAADARATADLFAAVTRGDPAAVRAAVDRGADLKARNADGVTAAALAVTLGRSDIARMLVAAQERAAAVASASRSSNPFDPGHVPEAAFHPVQVAPGAFEAVQAEAARAPTPATAPAKASPPVASAPETKPVVVASAPPPPPPAAPPAQASPPPAAAPEAKPAVMASAPPSPPPETQSRQPPSAAPEQLQAAALPPAKAEPAQPAQAAPAGGEQDNAAFRFIRNLFGSEPQSEKPAQGQATASLPTPAAAEQAPPPKRELVLLEGVILTVGDELRLGAARAMPAGPHPAAPPGCTFKQQASVAFCVEPTVWGQGMDKQVAVSSAVVYRGAKAIVRYDQGTATHIHSLFPSSAFPAVAEYYRQKFGTPTDSWVLPVRRPDAPVTETSVHVWQSRMPDGSVAILEIRQHDEARTGISDRRHGSLTLRDNRNLPIFAVVSQFELMLLK